MSEAMFVMQLNVLKTFMYITNFQKISQKAFHKDTCICVFSENQVNVNYLTDKR